MAAETNNPSQKPNQLTVPPPAPGTHVRTGGAPAAAPGAGAAARPQKEKALHCPRCNSTNTKFCYYNDYSLRMPRYFCKTCRRYWTEGGALRNVPAEKDTGPGSSSAVSAPAPAASTGSGGTTIPVVSLAAKKNPTLIHEGARDLGLAFGLPRHGDGRGLRPPGEFLSLETCGGACNDGDAGGRDVGVVSAMDLLRSTGCYVASPHVQLGNAAAAFALGELRMPPAPPPRRFSLDTGLQQDGEESAAGRLLFPFQALTLAASAAGGANAGADQYDAGKDEGGDSGDGEASSALRFVADIGEEVEVID